MSTRTKKTICLVTGWGCLAAVLGVVGGMEHFAVPMGRGAVLAFGLTAAGAALLWKAGWFRWRH